MPVTVYWEGDIVAAIDLDTDTLLAMRKDFQPLWNEFLRDGIDEIGPVHLSKKDEADGVLADAVYQSFRLGSFINRLTMLGFTIKEGSDSEWRGSLEKAPERPNEERKDPNKMSYELYKNRESKSFFSSTGPVEQIQESFSKRRDELGSFLRKGYTDNPGELKRAIDTVIDEITMGYPFFKTLDELRKQLPKSGTVSFSAN